MSHIHLIHHSFSSLPAEVSLHFLFLQTRSHFHATYYFIHNRCAVSLSDASVWRNYTTEAELIKTTIYNYFLTRQKVSLNEESPTATTAYSIELRWNLDTRKSVATDWSQSLNHKDDSGKRPPMYVDSRNTDAMPAWNNINPKTLVNKHTQVMSISQVSLVQTADNWFRDVIGHMQICTLNQTHLYPTTQFFTGWMPFLPPKQQCQSTESSLNHNLLYMYTL